MSAVLPTPNASLKDGSQCTAIDNNRVAGIADRIAVESFYNGGTLSTAQCNAGTSDCQLMILSLRQGELSVIYPIISLAYIWVTVCSYFIFHDTLNWLKLFGILSVIVGVAMLGRRKTE